MPHRNHRKKSVRQAEAARLRNKAKSSAMKTQVKRVLTAVESGDVTTARTELAMAMKRIDKAAKKRILHPNTAARRVSALARKVAQAEAQGR